MVQSQSAVFAVFAGAGLIGAMTGAVSGASADHVGVGVPVAVRASRWSAEQLAGLHRALKPLHAQYDPEEHMLRVPHSSPGYHTTLRGGMVHPTRNSLQYAVALMDTGDDALKERAIAVLLKVISLQDQDPASKTYGIWSWYLEEPLDRMGPPDWNWADFCGAALLQVALDHRERLSVEVRDRVDAALQHAARSIQRRDVKPGYTNIAIMGAYVTLVTAELLGLEDLRAYALARWRRFYAYTIEQGAFTEYNSPTYTVVALEQLGYLRLHAKDPEARRLTEAIYQLAWTEIARHFHAPTRQWSGPHSRCYSTLLRPGALALIQRATGQRVDFGVDEPGLLDHRLPLPCPPELEPLFTSLQAPREVIETFVRGEPPVIGTTHLERAFSLGSVNRGDLWNQRRPLLAYWGNATRPGYLRVRLLRDDYDFAAGQFFSVQQGGAVLAGINFAVDGGNTHVSLDRLKNGRVRLRDLRLRFEFGGAASDAAVRAPATLADPVALQFGELRVQLAALHAAFGGASVFWETRTPTNAAALDLVLVHGDEQEIDLGAQGEAAVGFALRLGTVETEWPEGNSDVADGRLRLRWNGLRLELPVRPQKAGVLQKAFRVAGAER